MRVAGRGERRNVGRGEDAALLENAVADLEAVGDDRAGGLVERRRPELHASAALPRRSPRSTSVISARIETAISAGDTAPMSSPTGPWMRAKSSRPQVKLSQAA